MNFSRFLVVAGAQRSASTTVAEYFARHPSIVMIKNEVRALEDPYYPRGLRVLLLRSVLANRRGRVLGMKRPELLHRPEGAERLAARFERAVVVISLRDPVTRTVSAYHHYVRHGLLAPLPLNEGLERLLDRQKMGRHWRASDQVLTYSRYSSAVASYRSKSGLTACVVLVDELNERAGDVSARVMESLGVSVIDLGPLPELNAHPTVDQYGVHRTGNRLCYVAVPECEAVRLSANPLRRGPASVMRAFASLLPQRKVGQEALDGSVRARLGAYFEEDLHRLEEILERPLPARWWREVTGQPA